MLSGAIVDRIGQDLAFASARKLVMLRSHLLSHSREHPMATVAVSPVRTSSREASRVALASAALGLIILWAVGFSPIGAVHNAAHDTRHAFAFPCH
jgi:cobalt transporter subunit CbtB